MEGFVNQTYFPREDITFSKYKDYTDNSKPTALFLSGVEFSALSLVQYADEICHDYNLVYVCTGERGVQTELEDILRVLDAYLATNNIKDVMLVGESAGAVIALNMAVAYPSLVASVVILNSATAYPRSDRTIRIIDLIRKMPDWYYHAAILCFVMLQKCDLTDATFNEMRMMTQMLINLLVFPKNELIHRIDKWIIRGCTLLSQKMHEITCPVLVVSSENDQMFESVQEAEILRQSIPNSAVVRVPVCDHLILRKHFPLHQNLVRHNIYK